MKRRGFFAALAGLVASPFVRAAELEPIAPAVRPLALTPAEWTDGLVRTFHADQSAYNAVMRDYLDNVWLATNPLVVVDGDKLPPVEWPVLPGKVMRIDDGVSAR